MKNDNTLLSVMNVMILPFSNYINKIKNLQKISKNVISCYINSEIEML